MQPTIPRLTSTELSELSGGALLVRYMECVRRYDRMPEAGWLRQRLDETGAELLLRHRLGTLSPALCGVLRHVHDGHRQVQHCVCATY